MSPVAFPSRVLLVRCAATAHFTDMGGLLGQSDAPNHKTSSLCFFAFAGFAVIAALDCQSSATLLSLLAFCVHAVKLLAAF